MKWRNIGNDVGIIRKLLWFVLHYIIICECELDYTIGMTKWCSNRGPPIQWRHSNIVMRMISLIFYHWNYKLQYPHFPKKKCPEVFNLCGVCTLLFLAFWKVSKLEVWKGRAHRIEIRKRWKTFKGGFFQFMIPFFHGSTRETLLSACVVTNLACWSCIKLARWV